MFCVFISWGTHRLFPFIFIANVSIFSNHQTAVRQSLMQPQDFQVNLQIIIHPLKMVWALTPASQSTAFGPVLSTSVFLQEITWKFWAECKRFEAWDRWAQPPQAKVIPRPSRERWKPIKNKNRCLLDLSVWLGDILCDHGWQLARVLPVTGWYLLYLSLRLTWRICPSAGLQEWQYLLSFLQEAQCILD